MVWNSGEGSGSRGQVVGLEQDIMAEHDILQREWDNGLKGRHLYKIQKTIQVKPFKGKCRREEVVMERLRLGHTGLRATLFIMAKSESNMCEECGVPENVEHVILQCRKYRNERTVLFDRLYVLERPCSLEGILGDSNKRIECTRALFTFLKDSELMKKI